MLQFVAKENNGFKFILQFVARQLKFGQLELIKGGKQMNINKKLKEKRLEANLTQQELADILHVSRQTISSWEVGRTYPDLDLLVALSELYSTPLDDLLKEDSEMIKDITEKVKKSERRKLLNIFLSILLIIMIGIGSFSIWNNFQNEKENAHGLKPNDLIESTWQLNYDPNKDLMDSILSFDSNSAMVRKQYKNILLNPFINIEELESEDPDMGLEFSTEQYKNLKIEVVDNTYVLSAQGYHETFEKLSDSVIRDSKGIEYYKISSSSTHESLQYLATQEENARKNAEEKDNTN